MMFLLLLLLPYIMAGLFTERHRYAHALYEANNTPLNAAYWQGEFDSARLKRDAIKHKSYCFTTLSSSYGCQNCEPKITTEWTAHNDVMKHAKAEKTKAVQVALKPGVIFGWPVYGTTVWLKSGKVEPSAIEISNESRILQLEKELEIER